MKQICVARSNDDVRTLLGHAQAVMSAIIAHPDRDDVYKNPDTSSITGREVLSSTKEVEIHAGANNYVITLTPDPGHTIDDIVTMALGSPSPLSPGPGVQTPRHIKGIKG